MYTSRYRQKILECGVQIMFGKQHARNHITQFRLEEEVQEHHEPESHRCVNEPVNRPEACLRMSLLIFLYALEEG